MIRQRSAAKNLPELIGVINEKNSHRVFFEDKGFTCSPDLLARLFIRRCFILGICETIVNDCERRKTDE